MPRILHVSDLHVDVPVSQIPARSLANKRLLGLANLLVRRGSRFSDARRKIAALAAFREEIGADVVVCTGDYTALGSQAEISAARAAVEPLTRAPLGFVTVPGNHDVYVPDAVEDRRFERAFAPFLRSDLPALAPPPNATFPLVRLVGEHVAVVAVNSARPNPQPWRSSGRIPADELASLATVLADPRVHERFVLVATHYAPRRRDGSPDTRLHGLENAEALLDACRPLRFGALVHGHIHWRYRVAEPGLALPLLCAGSTTDRGREGLWVLDVEPGHAVATPGRWDGARYALEPEAAHRWERPSPA